MHLKHDFMHTSVDSGNKMNINLLNCSDTDHVCHTATPAFD